MALDITQLRQRLVKIAGSGTATLFLELDDVEATQPPGAIWAVYVGAPAAIMARNDGGPTDPQQARPYFVGNVALFSSGIRSGAHHHFVPAHLVFPINEAILAAEMTLGDKLPVTFVPMSGTLIDGTSAPPQVVAPVRIGKMRITMDTSDSMLSRFSGSASGVGRTAKTGLQITGRFVAGGLELNSPALSMTIMNLFDEVGGAREVVRDLPVVLVADPRNTAQVGLFTTPPGVRPVAKAKIGAVGNGEFNFRLTVTEATSAVPEKCPSTTLTSGFLFVDGVRPPVRLTATEPWQCFGTGDQYMKSQ
jgi:hypothetical protein